MARISLINEEDHPELAEIIGQVRGARRGRLINVYRLLLHSPELAKAWFALNNAVRWKTRIGGRLRELMIIRIGYLCDAPYILRQHVPALAAAEGVTQAECDALRDWPASSLFDGRERAALEYADALTRAVGASDELFARLRGFFTEGQLVELTVLIGAYNMHARVLNGLELDLE
ncbi:MAG TPA: carboxymuconolactone decarboxylase family protein [Micropepsaceae bacterium]|nr:carboxymuconolactone decarboxylase family protein [Micropepsaceae bacterium]